MQYEALVIGGSYAGLSAAIHIARARRSVCVVDAGRPRNRFADASHGFFGQDGAAPLSMIERAREQLCAYPTVRWADGEASSAQSVSGGFEVALASGETLSATKLVLASGISDLLPGIPGLAERWGATVLHCPYCHGFEHAGRSLGVLQTMPASVHQALLVADWGPTTFFLDGAEMPDPPMLEKLARRGIAIEKAKVTALLGEEPLLTSARLADGRERPIEALFLAPPSRLNSGIAEQLGCVLEEGPFGPVIRTDAAKMTSVPGVYAAGDAARAPHNASWAAADGVTAGVSLHQSLVLAPLAA